MCMQFLLFLFRPHNLRILQPKDDNYSDNCSACRSQGKMTIWENMTICAIGLEVWFGQKLRRYREFISLNFSMLPLCYRYVIIYAYSTQICFYKEAVLCCFMLISLFFTSSKNGNNSSNSMGGSVLSTFQGVQRIHEVQIFICFFFAIIMLSFMQFLQG